MRNKISIVLSLILMITMIPAPLAYAEDIPQTDVNLEEIELPPVEEIPAAAEECQDFYYLEMNDGVLTGTYGADGTTIKNTSICINSIEKEGDYEFEVMDPLSSEDFDVWTFDDEGNGKITEKEAALLIEFEEYSGLFRVKDGKIYRPEEKENIVIDGIAYINDVDGSLVPCSKDEYLKIGDILYHVVDDNGSAEKVDGIYEGKYYEKGRIPDEEAPYTVRVGSVAYSVAADGTVSLLTGYHDGQYYKSGMASTLSGVIRGKFAIKGFIRATGSPYYAVYKSYLYKVDKEGNAKKYIQGGTKSYYVCGVTTSGTTYIYKADPKTAAAKKYIRNKRKSGTYKKTVGGVLYKVAYKTGKATVFTGVYNSRYYDTGKSVKPSANRYVVYGSYMYRLKTDGSCKKYIKKRNKSGKYSMTIGAYRYSIYYRNGKIAGTYRTSMTREEFLSCARGYLGINDNNYGHKVILDIYNSQSSLPRGYRISRYDPWCATFVSAMAVKMKCTDIIPTECSCYYQMLAWQKKGRWKETDSYVPSPGDIIYYDWNAAKTGDCRGFPDHVGIVENVIDGKITVIEGNYSPRGSHTNLGKVARRTIPVNYRYIRGFGLPKYKG